MKLNDIYELFVREGKKVDLRKPAQVQRSLSEKRKQYKQLKPARRTFFDKEALSNPYADTRVLYGNPNREVQRILVGIDIEVGELLMAKQGIDGGKPIDLVIAHHPEGIALAGLYDVMHLQTAVLENLGIEKTVSEQLMRRRIDEVTRRLHGANHTRSVDAARLLDMPMMCCHTPADNHVATYLQKLMDKEKPRTLGHVIDLLMKEPEYKDAMTNKAGPQVLVGKEKDLAGRILVDMTGGTEGSKDIFARMSQVGIKTLLGMHLSEAHYEKVKSEWMNVVIAGHMASDNLGMNLLLDKLQKKARQSKKNKSLEIIACSGFRRVER